MAGRPSVKITLGPPRCRRGGRASRWRCGLRRRPPGSSRRSGRSRRRAGVRRVGDRPGDGRDGSRRRHPPSHARSRRAGCSRSRSCCARPASLRRCARSASRDARRAARRPASRAGPPSPADPREETRRFPREETRARVWPPGSPCRGSRFGRGTASAASSEGHQRSSPATRTPTSTRAAARDARESRARSEDHRTRRARLVPRDAEHRTERRTPPSATGPKGDSTPLGTASFPLERVPARTPASAKPARARHRPSPRSRRGGSRRL